MGFTTKLLQYAPPYTKSLTTQYSVKNTRFATIYGFSCYKIIKSQKSPLFLKLIF